MENQDNIEEVQLGEDELHGVLVDAISGGCSAYMYTLHRQSNSDMPELTHGAGDQWNPDFKWKKDELTKLPVGDLYILYGLYKFNNLN